ncbi:MAG: hypothetical protein HPY44_21200 [Armatimonadetes bacterium]|nr:hypothetical protein [Armatimonadota bacterium]
MMPQNACEYECLKRIADGCAPETDDAALQELVQTGLARWIDPETCALVRRHAELLRIAEALRANAARREKPGGLRSMLVKLSPPARAAARSEADALRAAADGATDEAKEQWLELSKRGAVDLDLDLCATAGDGAVQITDTGRETVRSWLWSDEYEREMPRDGRLAARVCAFRSVRGELLEVGHTPDARLDLAAAVVSRYDTNAARLRELNRLATQHRWLNYDRLPVLAKLCRWKDDPGELWERFLDANRLMNRDWCAGLYETRLATVCLMCAGAVNDAAIDRCWEVLKRLRMQGWSLGPSSEPVAARLCALRLSPTQIAARVESLWASLKERATDTTPCDALAASVAADWNLHPLAARRDSAELTQERSAFHDYLDRFDETAALLGPEYDAGGPWVEISATLALMPGTVDGNVRRLLLVAGELGEVSTPNRMVIGLLLCDAVCGEWMDCGRLAWEIGSMLVISEPTSAFTAYTRTSPMWARAAAGAAPDKGPGQVSVP